MYTQKESSDILDKIFNNTLSKSNIFKDRNVLRNEYIPDSIQFRDTQMTSIAQIVSPLLTNHKPSNLLLYGKTGTGKTVVTKFVLKKLYERASKANVPLVVSYVNARNAATEYRILFELASTLDLQLPFTGLSISEAFNRILQIIKNKQKMLIFIIDEIDFLVRNFEANILYELTRANENLPQPSFISLIGISNDLQFKEALDPRTLSSLNEEEVVFPPYSIEQLQQILSQRAKLAFNDNTISESAINLCAALAGAEHGDARRAVDLLRVAAELAEREGASKIEDLHVRLATKSIEQDRVFEATRSLPLHAKIVLFTISQANEWPSTGSIYTKYTQICKRLGIEQLTQRRVSSILNELDTFGLISAPVISQGRLGRSKKIHLLAPLDTIISGLREDNILQQII
jgi:cell division control protein 6